MSKNLAIVGAFICCILVAVSIAIGVFVTRNAQNSCSKERFHDLPDKVRQEEIYFTTVSRSKVYPFDSNNNTVIGSFTTRPTIVKTAYVYWDYTGNVVAQAEKGALSFTFTIGRCPGAPDSETAPLYELERHFFILFGQVDYDLRKNGVLIGRPSKNTLFACRPDVVIEDMNGNLLATLDRSCFGSLITDSWQITNYQPFVVENYVLSMIAYVTTQYENEQQKGSTKKKNKRFI